MDIFKLDTLAETETIDKHNEDILLINDYLNIFIKGFNTFSGTMAKNEEQTVWGLIMVRSFHSMICATRLSISGFYAQSVALIRQLTENYLIFQNTNDKEVCAYLLRGEGKKPVWEKLARETNNLYLYNEAYRLECLLAHPSKFSLSIITDQNNALLIYPIYNEELYMACIEGLLKRGLLMSQCMRKLIVSLKGEATAIEWDMSNANCISKICNLLSELNTKLKDRIDNS